MSRLGWNQGISRQAVPPRPRLTLDQLEAAFKALGRRVDVSRHSGGGPDRKRDVVFAHGGDTLSPSLMSGIVAMINAGAIRGDKIYPAGTTITRREVLAAL